MPRDDQTIPEHDGSAWSLEDGEAVHAANPRSFFIPPAEHRRDIRPGEAAKLSFVAGSDPSKAGADNTEQLWVQVVDVGSVGFYRGRLDDDPRVVRGLKDGDVVDFEARHVVGLAYSPDELGYDPDAWAIVDGRILDHDEAPEALTFAEPVGLDEIDGRCWFLALDQSSPDESAWAKLGELTDRWPQLADVFATGNGMWRREASSGRYVRV